VLLAAVTFAGGMLGLQGRINGELGRQLHSAIAAATVSFAVGEVRVLRLSLSRQPVTTTPAT
jgi:uncharacterized membrane protein YdcZ (DUF606 family)